MANPQPENGTASQQILNLDALGFFVRAGVFGLEKRDNLQAAVWKLEADRQELRAFALSVLIQCNGDLSPNELRNYIAERAGEVLEEIAQ